MPIDKDLAKENCSPILKVNNLSVMFSDRHASRTVVEDISFNLNPGSTLALVGESGSGKSVTALSIMQLLPVRGAKITSGEVLFNGENLLGIDSKKIRSLRGNNISMIFQEPMTSLNPLMKVGDQVMEPLILHKNMSKEAAREEVILLFNQVGISNSRDRIDQYPHQFSGGQLQRIMIAMAISCKPQILIADEPTTALDVTIQKQVLELLGEIQKSNNMSVLFITHDLGIVAEIADEVAVMRLGKLVETGTVKQVFTKPNHAYTKGLLSCRPSLANNMTRLPTVNDFFEGGVKSTKFYTKYPSTLQDEVILKVSDLTKTFGFKKPFFGKAKPPVHAVKAVSFELKKGETFGLVGESGCGKTTLGRTIIRLEEPTTGDIWFKGENIANYSNAQLRPFRSKMQYIFQNPYASLNPKFTIASTLVEPMSVHGIGSSRNDRINRAVSLLEKVGLESSFLYRYPHQFSGGQRQRICIARALAVEPEFIICDESVSALDVSIQAQILNLLLDLQQELSLTYIFISHDLSVVKFMADRVAVMSNGEIVEMNDAESIYRDPQHPFSRKLLDSVPRGIPAGCSEAELYRPHEI